MANKQQLNQMAEHVPNEKRRLAMPEGGMVFDVDPTAGLPKESFPPPTPRKPMESATFPGTYSNGRS